MKIMWTKKAIEKIANALIKIGVLDKVVSDAATENTIAGRNAAGNVIVATPTANGHAATKKYVDDAVAGAGGVYLHNISFYDDNVTKTWVLKIVSTQSTQFTSFDGIVGNVLSISGDGGNGNVVLAVSEDDMNSPSIWYITDTMSIAKSSDPIVSDFTDTVTPL